LPSTRLAAMFPAFNRILLKTFTNLRRMGSEV
jgi:hypothetical protein